MRNCACGCGTPLPEGGSRAKTRQFISGHNMKKGEPKSEEHRKAIGDAQRRAWATKRKRMPVGSKHTDAQGYILVKVDPGGGRWRKEHLIVAEQMLGRALAKGEIVHHINGVRSDNRPGNLFVCRNRSHHNDVHRSEAEALRVLFQHGLVLFVDGRYQVQLPNATG